jgi:LmbE family N-acetylglucosaminyl deacetylase
MGSRVLVISPHPDDEAIGCGGTLRKHVVDGDHVRVCFLTSGEHGGHGATEEETRCKREREARISAAILGFHEIEFWGGKDGAFRVNRRIIERLAALIWDYQPDLIYVPNDLESHPDHRAAARLVKAARRRVDIELVVLMFEVWTPLTTIDEIVDISPFIADKVAAIRAYESQCAVLRFDEAALGLARYRGEMFCWPKHEPEHGRYAEVFRKQAP